MWRAALFELGHRQIFRRLSAPMQIVRVPRVLLGAFEMFGTAHADFQHVDRC